MSKTTPLPIRIPNDILEHVEDDAKTLRRSKASIIVEIIERHYENGGRHLGRPSITTHTKKAGAR
jgi:predicted DNA-binding protein